MAMPCCFRFAVLVGVSCSTVACDKGTSPVPSAPTLTLEPSPPAVRPIPAATGEDIAGKVVEFVGACDASGAVPIDARRFAVGDDEDSVLRVYDAELGGPPSYVVNVAEQLQLKKKKKGKKHRAKKGAGSPETDIEAATLLDGHAYWLTSHALTKDGERDPRRFRFFATEVPNGQAELGFLGTPYRSLVTDMSADPRLLELGIAEASKRRPDELGGLNVEGLTATPEGHMLIGFRNPVPHDQAIALPLLNPKEVLQQQAAKFGTPHLLALGGYGIRSLSSWHGNYLVIAGAIGDGGGSRLYKWDGDKQLQHVAGARFDDFNPEGFFTPEERSDIMVLSDDGARQVLGERCKDLEDVGQKRFRGMWLNLK